MRKLLYLSVLGSFFVACGPSAEELEEHEKKIESETLKLDEEFEKELESMSMEIGDTATADSTKN